MAARAARGAAFGALARKLGDFVAAKTAEDGDVLGARLVAHAGAVEHLGADERAADARPLGVGWNITAVAVGRETRYPVVGAAAAMLAVSCIGRMARVVARRGGEHHLIVRRARQVVAEAAAAVGVEVHTRHAVVQAIHGDEVLGRDERHGEVRVLFVTGGGRVERVLRGQHRGRGLVRGQAVRLDAGDGLFVARRLLALLLGREDGHLGRHGGRLDGLGRRVGLELGDALVGGRGAAAAIPCRPELSDVGSRRGLTAISDCVCWFTADIRTL